MSGRSGWPGLGASRSGRCARGRRRVSCPRCRARRSGIGGVNGSREAVLDRVRAALGPRPVVPDVPRDYRRTGDGGLDLFCERVAEYVANVHRIAAADLDAAVARLANGRTIATPELDIPPAELGGCVALTGCALAIAETGTIVLDGGPESGRRALTLVPDHHICVVRAEQIVSSVPEAIARLEPAARAGRPITFVSGPSATSDIELERVEGVHGPRQLDVFVVEDGRRAAHARATSAGLPHLTVSHSGPTPRA